MRLCKLCLQEKKLIKSHILPKFFFKKIIENGKLAIINEKVIVDVGLNGYFEKLLCQQCESIINRYETYSSRILNGILHNRMQYYQDGGLKIFTAINYHKMKLFFLSILWRSSITSNVFFKNIQLNNEQQEELRKSILNDDPGDEMYYPVILFEMDKSEYSYNNKNNLNLSVQSPYIMEYMSGHCFVFVANGFMMVYFSNNVLINSESFLTSIKLSDILQLPKRQMPLNYIESHVLKLINQHGK